MSATTTRWIKQKILTADDDWFAKGLTPGSCQQAALASLLNMSLGDVPHFAAAPPEDGIPDGWTMFRDVRLWLREHYDIDYCWSNDADVYRQLREAERELNGVKVQSGCYFVHRTRWDELRELAAAIKSLCTTFALSLCPIPDLPDMRSMVIEAYQDEVVDEVTKLVEQIEAFRRSGKPLTQERLNDFTNLVRTIHAQAEEHSRVLEVSQDRTAGAIENAWAVIGALASQIA